MIIKEVYADNFKSLVDFRMKLGHFTCLVGLNGAGKSTVLQFFDFLSQLVKGDLSSWLKTRGWTPAEISSKLTKRSNVQFSVLMEDDAGAEVRWSGEFNRAELRCTKEHVSWGGREILSVKDGAYALSELDEDRILQSLGRREIAFSYQGSILSQLKESQLPKRLLPLKRFFETLHSLDMLSPELLRQKTRASFGTLGAGGERLSAFLHEIGAEGRLSLVNALQQVYPSLSSIDVSALQSGWKQLKVTERFSDRSLITETRHINDGLLRVMAIFAQLRTAQSFLLLDEIENGVNPRLVEFLVDALVDASAQILVTTHSPLILNFLDDNTAISGVVYLYKAPEGGTQAIRFFDIPSMSAKLRVMGPGEVYEDTQLAALISEIREVNAHNGEDG